MWRLKAHYSNRLQRLEELKTACWPGNILMPPPIGVRPKASRALRYMANQFSPHGKMTQALKDTRVSKDTSHGRKVHCLSPTCKTVHVACAVTTVGSNMTPPHHYLWKSRPNDAAPVGQIRQVDSFVALRMSTPSLLYRCLPARSR